MRKKPPASPRGLPAAFSHLPGSAVRARHSTPTRRLREKSAWGMRARRTQIQSRGLPGESLARDRPTKSARRRLKGATSDGGPAPKAEREAPSGAACRERLAPEREKAARPRGGRRPFFFAKTRGAPANERGDPSGPPPGALLAHPRPLPAQRAPGAGGALVSHRVAPAVPSALAGLTSGFGMGPGVPRPPGPPAPGGRCGAGCERAGLRSGRPGGRTALEEKMVLRTVGGGGTYCVSRRARPISGARLRRSRALHLRPINQVVCLGPYRREGPSRGRLPA